MRRHRTDLWSLIAGIVAVGIAIVALAGGLRVEALDAGWAWPASLILLGLVVLATSRTGGRRFDSPASPPEEPPSSAPGAGAPASDTDVIDRVIDDTDDVAEPSDAHQSDGPPVG